MKIIYILKSDGRRVHVFGNVDVGRVGRTVGHGARRATGQYRDYICKCHEIGLTTLSSPVLHARLSLHTEYPMRLSLTVNNGLYVTLTICYNNTIRTFRDAACDKEPPIPRKPFFTERSTRLYKSTTSRAVGPT